MTDPAVAVEQSRLEALVGTVFEDRHYRHDCHCGSCTETRKHLAPNDRAFVDHVSSLVRGSPSDSNGQSVI